MGMKVSMIKRLKINWDNLTCNKLKSKRLQVRPITVLKIYQNWDPLIMVPLKNLSNNNNKIELNHFMNNN